MLSSEKYAGDMLLQKTLTTGAAGYQVKNIGQQDMYFIRNSHEPIIDRGTWERVQEIKGAPVPKYMRIAEAEMITDVAEEVNSGFEMKMC